MKAGVPDLLIPGYRSCAQERWRKQLGSNRRAVAKKSVGIGLFEQIQVRSESPVSSSSFYLP